MRGNEIDYTSSGVLFLVNYYIGGQVKVNEENKYVMLPRFFLYKSKLAK